MPRFVSDEPDEFYNSATATRLMLRHESGHILFAHYYGFGIGPFRYMGRGPYLAAGFKNIEDGRLSHVDPDLAEIGNAQKLIAGELSARIFGGLPIDQIVLPVPNCDSITAATPIASLNWDRKMDGHDAIRVLKIVHNLGVTDWWTWIWTRHAETEAILRDHLAKVEALADRLFTIPPYANDEERGTNQPRGQITGPELLEWCREFAFPVRDATYSPRAI